MNKLDLTKPIVSRGGHPVRVICTDAKADEPIIALHLQDGIELLLTHFSDGRYLIGSESEFNLINMQIIEERWMNIYPEHGGTNPTTSFPYPSRKDADEGQWIGRLAILHYQLIDGIPSNPEFIKP